MFKNSINIKYLLGLVSWVYAFVRGFVCIWIALRNIIHETNNTLFFDRFLLFLTIVTLAQ